MSLNNRIAALEAAVNRSRQPFERPGYAADLYAELITGRGIPLPPFGDEVDARRTAELWVRDGGAVARRFVLRDGAEVTAAALAERNGGTR